MHIDRCLSGATCRLAAFCCAHVHAVDELQLRSRVRAAHDHPVCVRGDLVGVGRLPAVVVCHAGAPVVMAVTPVDLAPVEDPLLGISCVPRHRADGELALDDAAGPKSDPRGRAALQRRHDPWRPVTARTFRREPGPRQRGCVVVAARVRPSARLEIKLGRAVPRTCASGQRERVERW